MIFKRPFNKEERALAILFGVAPLCIVGPWALPLACVVWIPWCMGGAGYGRVWRYLGCPSLLALAFLAAGRPWWEVVGAMATVAGFLPGYGVPDPPDRAGRDEGSTIGKFWYDVAARQFGGYSPGNWNEIEMLTTIYTRMTVFAIFLLGYVPVLWREPRGVAVAAAVLLVGSAVVVCTVEGEFNV